MTWSDFQDATALERDVLRRALPTVPSSGQTHARATYDATKTTQISIGVTETVGFAPETCVERLALRPLLVGAAWKVLDLLLEHALAHASLPHDRNGEYTIGLKQRHARTAQHRPARFATAVWAPLMGAYDATVEIRHSLVHRRAHTDTSGALVGVDRNRNPLRPLVPTEQEAFVRAALSAADAALASSVHARDEARLLSHLAALTALTGHPVAAASQPTVIPEITIVVDSDQSDPSRYLIDLPAVRAWLPFPTAGDCADVIVAPRDRPGQELRGRLEDAPHSVVYVDPDAPPAWLR